MNVEKTKDGWRAQSGGKTVRGTKASTKAEAVKKTAAVARADKEAVSVKIRKENGRIQEERTYPRKADPGSSKG